MDLGSGWRSFIIGTIAVAAPTVPPAATEWWQVESIDLFGARVQIASMLLSLFGLGLARGVAMARARDDNKREPGGWYLTGTLLTILIGLNIERQPTPGLAVAWGVGIGLSGIVLLDIMRDRFLSFVRNFELSRIIEAFKVLSKPADPADAPSAVSPPLETERETE